MLALVEDNLFQRVMSVVFALPILALILCCANAQQYQFFVMCIMLLSAREWGRLAGCDVSAFAVAVLSVLAAIWLLPLLYIEYQLYLLFFMCVLLLLGSVPALLTLFKIDRALVVYEVPGFWLLIGVFLHMALAYSFVLIREVAMGLFVSLLVSIWINDIGAYAMGRCLGKTSVTVLSPNKTLEGFWGGAFSLWLFIILVLRYVPEGLFIATWFNGLPSWLFFLFTFMSAVALSTIYLTGDVFESALKRRARVKDSGNFLPGHGGILDRLDSMFLSVPWILLCVLYHQIS